jgi:uncharacterized protein YndB with AHSA1/START domain
MTTVTDSTHSLEVRQVVAAPPAQVYAAWTTPELLAKWFAPADTFSVVVHAADARVGGRYRIEMVPPQGPSHIAIGEYRELAPTHRLAFTWRWENQPPRDTLVTVEITAHPDGAEVVLRHSLFLTADDRDHHRDGWLGCLARLEAGIPPSR